MMNWLSAKEHVRKMRISSLMKGKFKLRQKEAYALAFATEGSLVG